MCARAICAIPQYDIRRLDSPMVVRGERKPPNGNCEKVIEVPLN